MLTYFILPTTDYLLESVFYKQKTCPLFAAHPQHTKSNKLMCILCFGPVLNAAVTWHFVHANAL
jgi:hypothetical protein